MASAKLKKIFRVVVSFSLLLVVCLPAAATIHAPVGLEQLGPGRQTMAYAPCPKAGGAGDITSGRRANFQPSMGFHKIDWVVRQMPVDPVVPSFSFSADFKARLRHRADRTAISIRAPPR